VTPGVIAGSSRPGTPAGRSSRLSNEDSGGAKGSGLRDEVVDRLVD